IIAIISSIGLRELPRVGSFMSMIFVGLFLDSFNWGIPNPTTFLIHLISFALGLFLLAMGSCLVISDNLGAGPRDSLMLLIVKKVKISIRVARTIMEVSVAVVGFLLGGPIGIGTVIMAFGIGPIMQVSLRYSKETLDHLITDKQLP